VGHSHTNYAMVQKYRADYGRALYGFQKNGRRRSNSLQIKQADSLLVRAVYM
jgi:hypothetical protein